MQWTHLIPLPLGEWFDDSLAADAEAFNTEIVRLRGEREAYDRRVAEIQSSRDAELENLDFVNLVGFDGVKEMLATILQRELGLRRRLATFLDERYYPAASQAAEKALLRFEQAREKVRAGLRKLGYDDPADSIALGIPNPCAFFQGWPDRHRTVYEARREAGSLYTLSKSGEWARANAESAKEVVKQLGRLRDKALA